MLWNLALLWNSPSNPNVQNWLQTMKQRASVTPSTLELTIKFWIFSLSISVSNSLWIVFSLSSIWRKQVSLALYENFFPLIRIELHWIILQFSDYEMEKREYCNLPSLDSSPIYILLLCLLLFIFIQSWTKPVLSISLCYVLIYAVWYLQIDVICLPLFSFLVVWIPHRLSLPLHDIILRD